MARVPLRGLLVVSCCAIVALISSRASAQEDVIHRRNGIVERGKIVAQDAAGIRLLRSDSRKETLIPAEQIERIEVKLTPEQQEGEQLLEQRDYRSAAAKFQAALANETRGWLRGKIATQMMTCHLAQGDAAAAIDAFAAVSQATGGQLPWSAVPVWWLPEPFSGTVLGKASEMLQSAQPVEQVIGASFLFGTSESQAARETLARLTTYRDERLGQLARTQLWRWETATATREEIASWQRQVMKMPAELRAGPYFVIALALSRLGAHDEAVLAYVWPALVFRNDTRLSARAALYAAELLEKTAQNADAQQFYSEIIQRFSDSAEAIRAQQRLEALKE